VSNTSSSITTRRGDSGVRLEELQLEFPYRLRFGVLVLAAVALFSGVAMALLGLQGSRDLGLQVAGAFEARFVNASPGIVFATIGAILCWIMLSQGPPSAGLPVRVRACS
jgi:hypothetical protein